ncbi:MAG: DUF2867 domain-containing protein [bacterium]
MSEVSTTIPLVLITGATGYVGGRLLKALEQKNLPLRCLTRHPEFLHPNPHCPTEVMKGDVLDPESLKQAMTGVHTAYYLVHSLGSAGSFIEEDRRGALHFSRAAKEAGVQRIIYLGGLGEGRSGLSDHLKSRQEVGECLREGGVPVIEFRASIIIGSGSLSFEMIRALVERLPLMTTPSWVKTPAQPIAIEDVIDYLVAALDLTGGQHRIFDIGGADVTSYKEIMQEYARQRNLRRWMIPVPVLTPNLSSLWLAWVTPLYARVGKKLIEGIRNATLVKNPEALETFPVRPMGIRESIARALKNEDQEFAQTHWSDALSSVGPRRHWGGIRFKNRLVDSRTLSVPVPPEDAFRPIQRIGGKTGWYYADFLWRIRGFLDRLAGGVGLRRGRRDSEDLSPGDALDFWRVEVFEPPHRLLLQAEMKLPGRAWLEFEVEKSGQGSLLRQTALFDPVGLRGLLYWYLLYPLHQIIFAGMLKKIADKARNSSPSSPP